MASGTRGASKRPPGASKRPPGAPKRPAEDEKEATNNKRSKTAEHETPDEAEDEEYKLWHGLEAQEYRFAKDLDPNGPLEEGSSLQTSHA